MLNYLYYLTHKLRTYFDLTVDLDKNLLKNLVPYIVIFFVLQIRLPIGTSVYVNAGRGGRKGYINVWMKASTKDFYSTEGMN